VCADLDGDVADLLAPLRRLPEMPVDAAADQHRDDHPGDGPDPVGGPLHPGRGDPDRDRWQRHHHLHLHLADRLLQAGTATLDEDEVRVDGLATTNDDNEFPDLIGVLSLASTGTVWVACTSSSLASENAQLLPTLVATVHQR
jgi:hypothetical protein